MQRCVHKGHCHRALWGSCDREIKGGEWVGGILFLVREKLNNFFPICRRDAEVGTMLYQQLTSELKGSGRCGGTTSMATFWPDRQPSMIGFRPYSNWGHRFRYEVTNVGPLRRLDEAAWRIWEIQLTALQPNINSLTCVFTRFSLRGVKMSSSKHICSP